VFFKKKDIPLIEVGTILVFQEKFKFKVTKELNREKGKYQIRYMSFQAFPDFKLYPGNVIVLKMKKKFFRKAEKTLLKVLKAVDGSKTKYVIKLVKI
jgi:hypothetical protein